MRPIKNVQATHRSNTLQAIANHVHATTARIVLLKTESERLRDIVKSMPATAANSTTGTPSRIDWLHRQLQNP